MSFTHPFPWSGFVQTPETLYLSRSIRFREEYREHFISSMHISNGKRILETGCGPGCLCHRIATWLPDSSIIGVDSDPVFIAYAREKTPEDAGNCT